MERYFGWITRRRRLVTGVSLALVLTCAVVASRVRVDYSVEQFFPTWGPERAIFDEYRRIFTQEDAQVAFFLETPAGLDRRTLRTLDDVGHLFEEAGLEGVRWARSVPAVAAATGDSEALAAAAEAVRAHPLYRGFLWNAEGTVHVVQGVLPPARNTDAERRALERTLTGAIGELGIDARWALSGTPVIRARVPEPLRVDQTVLLGGGIVLFFAILYGYFRHVGRVFITLAAVAPAYLVTLALMAALGKPVTVLTSFIPIVILVVGVCDSTHLLEHWRRARAAGAGPAEAVVDTYRGLVWSCFFTSLTTALGFASLVATGIGVVADFGALTALAAMATYAFTVTLLPALLSFGRAEASTAGRPRRGPGGLTGLLLRRARAAAVCRPRWILPLAGGIAAVSVALASTVRIDTYLVDDLDDDVSVMRDLRWIEDAGFGLFQTNLFVQAAANELTEPEMLAWMQRFQRFAESEPIVASTFGLPDLVDALAPDGTERSASSAARVQVALDAAAGVAPEVLGGLLRPDASAAQVVVTVRDEGSRATLPFLERVDAHLEADPPPFGRADVTGTVRMAHTFSFHVLRSFGPSVALALGLIWLVMVGLFRSPRLGLLAMVPNVLPLLVLGGVMGLAGVPLKPSSILVFSIAFGIAVDDSIHLMGRFTQLIGRGLGPRRALGRALRETGPALVMSTVVVSAGFSLLLLSRFELLSLVGILTATTAATALAADLFVFPALLLAAPPRAARSE